MNSAADKTVKNARAPGGYFRWLKVCGSVLRLFLCAPPGNGRAAAARRLILTRSRAQETLLKGFPGLVAVPAALFPHLAETLALPAFPRAGSTEEDLLVAVRDLERRSGQRFDWDAFLGACERRNRLARAAQRLSDAIRRKADPPLDTASAQTAFAALAKELNDRKE